jgi:hypothetical protein
MSRPIGDTPVPVLPPNGNYLILHVSEDGKIWVSTVITREYLERAIDLGPALTRMLDRKVQGIRDNAKFV